MKIANPLYDHAFKYLMSNDKLAKKVLSTILEQEVLELELAQQEIIIEDKLKHFTLYRLDFKAKIKNDQGKEELVLIELQKSKLPTNELRFRNYLGSAYSQKKTKQKADKATAIETLPIIAIYIMGYNLVDIPVMAVTVDRKIINASTKEELDIQSNFIELLTHKCYILQVRRLPKKRRTKLEEFMTLFNQAWISNDNYILDLEYVPEAFSDIAEYLHRPLESEEMVRQLAAEDEVELLFASQEAEIAKAIARAKEARTKLKEAKAKEKEAREKEKEAKQKEKEAKQKEKEARKQEKEAKERAQEAKERAQEAKERAQEAQEKTKEINLKLAKKMLKYGESIEDTIAETGLDKAIIIALKEEI
jgi:hypothetical protein